MELHHLPRHVQDLVLLYLAVTSADNNLDLHERAAAVALLRDTMPGLELEAARAIIDTAHLATRSGLAEDPEVIARSLRDALTPDRRRGILSDLGRLAQADGHVSFSEATVIAQIRAAWSDSPQPAE